MSQDSSDFFTRGDGGIVEGVESTIFDVPPPTQDEATVESKSTIVASKKEILRQSKAPVVLRRKPETVASSATLFQSPKADNSDKRSDPFASPTLNATAKSLFDNPDTRKNNDRDDLFSKPFGQVDAIVQDISMDDSAVQSGWLSGGNNIFPADMQDYSTSVVHELNSSIGVIESSDICIVRSNNPDLPVVQEEAHVTKQTTLVASALVGTSPVASTLVSAPQQVFPSGSIVWVNTHASLPHWPACVIDPSLMPIEFQSLAASALGLNARGGSAPPSPSNSRRRKVAVCMLGTFLYDFAYEHTLEDFISHRASHAQQILDPVNAAVFPAALALADSEAALPRSSRLAWLRPANLSSTSSDPLDRPEEAHAPTGAASNTPMRTAHRSLPPSPSVAARRSPESLTHAVLVDGTPKLELPSRIRNLQGRTLPSSPTHEQKSTAIVDGIASVGMAVVSPPVTPQKSPSPALFAAPASPKSGHAPAALFGGANDLSAASSSSVHVSSTSAPTVAPVAALAAGPRPVVVLRRGAAAAGSENLFDAPSKGGLFGNSSTPAASLFGAGPAPSISSTVPSLVPVGNGLPPAGSGGAVVVGTGGMFGGPDDSASSAWPAADRNVNAPVTSSRDLFSAPPPDVPVPTAFVPTHTLDSRQGVGAPGSIYSSSPSPSPFAAPAPGSVGKYNGKVSAEDVFARAAPVVNPNPNPNAPPSAPGVTRALPVFTPTPTPASTSSIPSAPAPAAVPASKTGAIPVGMILTPHGLAPDPKYQKPREKAASANSNGVNTGVEQSIAPVKVSSNLPPRLGSIPSTSASSFPTPAPAAGPPPTIGADAPTASQPSAALSHPSASNGPRRPTLSQIGKPKYCPIVAFGFGGALCIINYPKPAYADSGTGWGGEVKCVGKLQVGKLCDLLQQQVTAFENHAAMYSESQGASAANKDAKEYAPLYHAPPAIAEMHSILHVLSIFSQPLVPGSEKDEKRAMGEARKYLTLRERFPVGTAMNGVTTDSEKLLLSLVSLILETGAVSSSAGAAAEGSPERRIINLLLAAQPAAPGDRTTHLGPEQLKPLYASHSSSAANQSTDLVELHAQIEYLLLHGDREGAVTVALQHQLWHVALLVAPLCSTARYQETIRTMSKHCFPQHSPLHALSMVYSNQGDALFSTQKTLLASSSANQSALSPQTATSSWEGITGNAVWRRAFSALLANKTAETHRVVKAFGDRLMGKDGGDVGSPPATAADIMAAHFCYLAGALLPVKHARFSLLGCDMTSIR